MSYIYFCNNLSKLERRPNTKLPQYKGYPWMCRTDNVIGHILKFLPVNSANVCSAGMVELICHGTLLYVDHKEFWVYSP